VSIAEVGGSGMKRETALLNIICIVAAVGFVALAVLNAIFSGDFLTTDNLFLTSVCLVLALMFAVNPLLYLKSEGKLPIPFQRSTAKEIRPVAGSGGAGALTSGSGGSAARSPVSSPPLLDAKGRAVPTDVKNMVENFKQPQQNDG
jgi:hypothetical protein